MAKPVFEMFGRLSLDKSNYDKSLSSAEKSSSSFVSKLNKGLSTIAKGVATGLAATTAAVVSLTKASLDGFANYEQLKGGVETLFKNSADIIMGYANVAYKTAGLSANQYMETVTSFAASLLQSVGGDTVKAADVANRAVIDMSDNANKLGTDMASIQNAYMGFAKQNYLMLDNLKLGYSGTKTEMERLIQDASKMKEEQEELNVKVDAGSLSFANIVNAISVVQKHLGIAGTTASEASTTIQGSTMAMKAAWNNLLVGMADDTQDMTVLINNFVDSFIIMLRDNLVPRLKVILSGIGDFITQTIGVLGEQLPVIIESLLPPLVMAATTLFTQLAAAIPTLLEILLAQLPLVIETIVGVVPQLVDALLNALPMVLQVAIQLVMILIQGLTDYIPQLIPVAITIVSTLVETLLANLPKIIDAGVRLLIALLGGIINSIPQLVSKLPQIIDAISAFFTSNLNNMMQIGVKLLTALVKSLPKIISTIVAALPQIITSIVNFFTSSVTQMVQAGITLLTALIGALPQIIQAITGAMPQIINAICATLTQNLPTIIQAGVELFTALIRNLPQIIQTIVQAVPQIVSSLGSAFAQRLPNMWSIGKSLVEGIWTGISKAGSWLGNQIRGWANDIIGGVKRIFGIHSPSTVMRDQVGLMLGEGVAEGINNSLRDVEDASDKLMGAIPNIENKDFSINMKRNISDTYSVSYKGMASAFIEAIQEHGLYAIVQADQASETLEPIISNLQARQMTKIERSGLYATV